LNRVHSGFEGHLPRYDRALKVMVTNSECRQRRSGRRLAATGFVVSTARPGETDRRLRRDLPGTSLGHSISQQLPGEVVSADRRCHPLGGRGVPIRKHRLVLFFRPLGERLGLLTERLAGLRADGAANREFALVAFAALEIHRVLGAPGQLHTRGQLKYTVP